MYLQTYLLTDNNIQIEKLLFLEPRISEPAATSFDRNSDDADVNDADMRPRLECLSVSDEQERERVLTADDACNCDDPKQNKPVSFVFTYKPHQYTS